jgi:hypothetical protein
MSDDPSYANVVLLAVNESRADGSTTFVDQSLSAHALTAHGGFQWDTAQAPANATSSGLLDHVAGSFLSTPDHADYDFGSGDWTIEFWVRWLDTGDPIQMLLGDSTQFAPFIFLISGGLVKFYASSNGSSFDVANGVTIKGGGGIPANGNWYHVEVDRSGSTYYTFWDGVQTLTWSNAAALVGFPSALLSIGADPDGANPMNGWMAGVRITKGVARHTAGFSPPTLPLYSPVGASSAGLAVLGAGL